MKHKTDPFTAAVIKFNDFLIEGVASTLTSDDLVSIHLTCATFITNVYDKETEKKLVDVNLIVILRLIVIVIDLIVIVSSQVLIDTN